MDLLALARDPRFDRLFDAAEPAWLFSGDAERLLAANAPARRILNLAPDADLKLSTFGAANLGTAQLARVAGQLPRDGSGRLERLRLAPGFSGATLLCRCLRVRVDNDSALLITATGLKATAIEDEDFLAAIGTASPGAALVELDGTLIAAAGPARLVALLGQPVESLYGAAGRAVLDKLLSSGERVAAIEGFVARLLGEGRDRRALILGAPLRRRPAPLPGFPSREPVHQALPQQALPQEPEQDAVPAETPAWLAAEPEAEDAAAPRPDMAPVAEEIEPEARLLVDPEIPAPLAAEAGPLPDDGPADDVPADDASAEAAPEILPVAEDAGVDLDSPAEPIESIAMLASTTGGGGSDGEPDDIVQPAEPVATVEAEPEALVAEKSFAEALGEDSPADRKLKAELAAFVANPPPQDVAPVETAPPAADARPQTPLRFVWQSDAEHRFTMVSQQLAEVVGTARADLLGRSWADVAASLGLDPEGRILRALERRDTWSGVRLAWPTGGATPLTIELAGLPVFDRERNFQGYRGFGVWRAEDVETLDSAPSAPPESAPVITTPTLVPPASQPPRAEPPMLAEPKANPYELVNPPPNVVQLRNMPTPERRLGLSPVERNAFREIAKALGARLPDSPAKSEAPAKPETPAKPEAPSTPERLSTPSDQPLREPAAADTVAGAAAGTPALDLDARLADARLAGLRDATTDAAAMLDRLPAGVVVMRGERVLHANRAFRTLTGSGEITTSAQLAQCFADGADAASRPEEGTVTVRLAGGATAPYAARLHRVAWCGASALMMALGDRPVQAETKPPVAAPALVPLPQARAPLAGAIMLPRPPAKTGAPLREILFDAERRASELAAILDTATDGIVIIDGEGTIERMNRSAEALFGYEGHDLHGKNFTNLFAPESHRAAVDYLDGLLRNGVASVLNDGRELFARVKGGGLIPVFMTMGRIGDGEKPRLCAVFRDIAQWKRAEEELVAAKRNAELVSSQKSDFLTKISHEIRTPLNAIIGFSEVMMEERFGRIAVDRYREYLRDIHASGTHLLSLVNDLLDLSKIEAGKMDLNFASVDLNDIVTTSVAIMQQEANRERIIIRTSISRKLPAVVADARAMRQIVLNLLSNSIKFTPAGGQVIVSTALSDNGEAVLRIRDTGIGMSEGDLATALEPFRQIATASARTGSGLGLPLTKALAEANRARFRITSVVNQGTLAEVIFPSTRVLAG